MSIWPLLAHADVRALDADAADESLDVRPQSAVT